MRDVRTLRTLALLDLESHPPAAAIDRVTIVIDPTPGRVLQHTLFTRAHPTPEQLSTLLARLGALMGQDRIGAPATVDSYRPGAFAMTPFATEHHDTTINAETRGTRRETSSENSADSASSALNVVSAVELHPHLIPSPYVCPAPLPPAGARARGGGRRPAGARHDRSPRLCRRRGDALRRSLADVGELVGQEAGRRSGRARTATLRPTGPRDPPASWDRDEWDVSLSDGAVYRIFQDREPTAGSSTRSWIDRSDDMTIAELLLPEVEQEMATTRRVLERVPDDKLAWKPHDRSWSMGDLASHIVNSIKWTDYTMNQTEFDLGSVTPEEMNQAAKSRAELLAWFDANAASARQALAKSDADYFVPWTLKKGRQVFFTMPRYNCMRSFC